MTLNLKQINWAVAFSISPSLLQYISFILILNVVNTKLIYVISIYRKYKEIERSVMRNVEENLAKSLTADSVELIPYIPYLLQDLWELGSSPEDILHLILSNTLLTKETKVLDLACGKGAVSIYLARKLGCKVKGIDIIPEFIAYANEKAKEFNVESLCEFEVGDITECIKIENDYDIVIYGAVGNVLGSWEETLN